MSDTILPRSFLESMKRCSVQKRGSGYARSTWTNVIAALVSHISLCNM